MDFCLRAISLFGCLRRTLYLVWEDLSCRYFGQVFHPTQAKFVVCDYTIENRLHWRRDATLGEDRCDVRFPSVAQMLAVLNTVVLSLMDLVNSVNVGRFLRVLLTFGGKPQQFSMCARPVFFGRSRLLAPINQKC